MISAAVDVDAATTSSNLPSKYIGNGQEDSGIADSLDDAFESRKPYDPNGRVDSVEQKLTAEAEIKAKVEVELRLTVEAEALTQIAGEHREINFGLNCQELFSHNYNCFRQLSMK